MDAPICAHVVKIDGATVARLDWEHADIRKPLNR